MRALEDELQRTVLRLRMGELERPYFASFTASDVVQSTLRCDFGGLVAASLNHYRGLKAEVRVGEASFDDTHYVSGDTSSYRAFVGVLPLEDDYDALRFSAWSLADEAYKSALERLSQKRAYKTSKSIVEELPDLTQEKPVRTLLPPTTAAFDWTAWEPRVCEAAAVFRKHPAIQESWVYMNVSVGNRYFVNSEGTEFIKPVVNVEIKIGGTTQARDGMETRYFRRLVFRAVEDIPPAPRLIREVEDFAAELSEWSTAAPESEYVGPVLFEGAGAAEFFNQMLGHQAGNPRSLWLENDEDRQRFPSGAFASRIGLRVAAPFLNATDDPTLQRFEGVALAGHYVVDDEGVLAQPVTVVEKGRVKDILMSRAPVKGKARSNGHGRAAFWELPTARPANLIVSSDSGIPKAELRKKFLELVKEAGLEYGLLVKRLNFEDEKDGEELLSSPSALYRVHVKDGREERVRDLEFDAVSPRALRDVAAVSKERSVYNFHECGYLDASGGGELGASVVAPSVLVREMEFKKTEKKPGKLPYLKHPFFD